MAQIVGIAAFFFLKGRRKSIIMEHVAHAECAADADVRQAELHVPKKLGQPNVILAGHRVLKARKDISVPQRQTA